MSHYLKREVAEFHAFRESQLKEIMHHYQLLEIHMDSAKRMHDRASKAWKNWLYGTSAITIILTLLTITKSGVSCG